MRSRGANNGGWDEEDGYAARDASYDTGGYNGYGEGDDTGGYDEYGQDGGYGDEGYGGAWGDESEERGLVLQPEHSLVGVSSTVTHHGAPLLSYTHTMNRFYASRKQKLSLGRFKCEVCGDRIRFWAWETESGGRTHDGCYERMAWTWTNLYAYQQRLAADGRLE
jgi:hypothetical protein